MRFIIVLIATLALCVACKPEAEKMDSPGEEHAEGEAAAHEAEHAAGDEHGDPAHAQGEGHGDEHAAGDEHGAGEHPAEAGAAECEALDRLEPGMTCHYGGQFALETEPVALTAALDKVDALLEKPVKIEGTVGMSCRKKGCWMTLQPGADAEPVRVTFKDYKFFVPKFADGASAVLEGTFVQETLSEGTRKHLARDANKPEAEVEAITGDEHIVQFVATAVELTGGKTEPSP